MKNKTHDILKYIAMIWLPAFGTLVFALTDLWSVSWGQQAVGTIMALDTFLGVILGISTRTYNMAGGNFDGHLIVDQEDPLKDTYTLDLKTPLSEIPGKTDIRLKVATPADLAPPVEGPPL